MLIFKPALFDDLVGAGEDGRRDRQTKRLRGLEIDQKLKRRRLLNRQIGRLGAVENFSDVDADPVKDSREAGAIADQTAGPGVCAANKSPQPPDAGPVLP